MIDCTTLKKVKEEEEEENKPSIREIYELIFNMTLLHLFCNQF